MKDTRPTLLVKGGRILDIESDPHRPTAADILVENGVITKIEPASAVCPAGAMVIDASDRLVTPGFVNAHYHSHDILLKGCFDPLILEFWAVNALPRVYPPRSDEEVRLRTLLGAIECIRGGITTIQDMLTLFPLTARQAKVVQNAYDDAGLRVILGLQLADVSPFDTVPYWRQLIPPELRDSLAAQPAPSAPPPLEVAEEIFGSSQGEQSIVKWAVAPSSPERCTRRLMEELAAIAGRHDLPIYSHIYISRAEALNARRAFPQHGGSLVAYLKELGILGPRLTLAHGVWLSNGEIDVLADSRTNVVLNPVSNLKNKNGVAPIRKLIDAGVNLSLGCDNGSCSDAQNIFQAMKMFTLLAAVSDPREGPPTAVDALRAATSGGLRTAGLADRIGAIREGMRADLVIFDSTDPVYLPLNSAARQLVYGEGGRGVESVIIDGRIVMLNRKIMTVDELALRSELGHVAAVFQRDAQAVFARTERLHAHISEADRRMWQDDLGFDRYLAR